MRNNLNDADRASRPPSTDSPSASSRAGGIDPGREQLGWGRRIWNWMSRALSLAILGKSSDYHMAQFNAEAKYWNEVVAGRKSLPQATANSVMESPVQK
jgi:hypothetical protein